MVYVRGLDERWREQPAVSGLSATAFRTYVDSLLYVVERELDGRLPTSALGARARRAAPELLEAGLWRLDGDGWLVVQWERHGASRAARDKARAAAVQRVRRHRGGGDA